MVWEQATHRGSAPEASAPRRTNDIDTDRRCRTVASLPDSQLRSPSSARSAHSCRHAPFTPRKAADGTPAARPPSGDGPSGLLAAQPPAPYAGR
jgi:hypothetical protein